MMRKESRLTGIAAKTAGLLLAAVLAISAAGCHGRKAGAGFAVPDAFDTDKKLTVTFWAKNDTNKTQTKIYEKAIADFEALYPNVTVSMRLYTDYGKIYNDVITNIATGTTPDVCITYPDHIATYMTGTDVVVPLDELMDHAVYGLGGSGLMFDSPARDEIVPEFLEEGRLGEHWYALPYMRSTEACYVNKDFVEALGYEVPDVLTWDFVWEVSEAAMKKDKKGLFKLNGQKVLIPFIYKSTDNMMISMLKQLGAGYSSDEGEVLIFNDETKDLLAEIAGHAKSGAFSTFKISGYPANFLNAGQCIFAVDSTAGATWMGSEAPLVDISEDKLVKFETAVRPIPQFDPENPEMISQGPSLCLFHKNDPQQVLASWLFMQYLLTNDVQIAYSGTEGYVPVTKKAQESETYQDYLSRAGEDNREHYQVKIDAAELLMAYTDRTFTTPVFNGSASLRDAAGYLIEDVTKSVRRRQKANDAYFKELFKKVNSLYHLDQLGAGDTGEEGGKRDLGPLPAESKALLTGLAVIWVLLAAGFVSGEVKKRRGDG